MSDPSDETLKEEITALRTEVTRLNEHKFIRMLNSTPRMMWISFLRGLATGLGTVVGATLLVSIMLYFLSQIELMPIIGDWAKQIAEEIQAPAGE